MAAVNITHTLHERPFRWMAAAQCHFSTSSLVLFLLQNKKLYLALDCPRETAENLHQCFNSFTFTDNTEELLSRCQQQHYLLRKPNSIGVNSSTLRTFYHCFIENVMAFSIICWYAAGSIQSLCRRGTVCSAES